MYHATLIRVSSPPPGGVTPPPVPEPADTTQGAPRNRFDSLLDLRGGLQVNELTLEQFMQLAAEGDAAPVPPPAGPKTT